MASTRLTIHTERNPKAGEGVHVDLANLPDGPAALAYFTERWGPLPDAEELPWYQYVLRSDWRDERDPVKVSQKLSSTITARTAVTARGIKMEPTQLWDTVFLLFLWDWSRGLAGYCGNPTCANPFFIRARKTQKVCDVVSCKNYLAKQRRKKWRDANGTELRTPDVELKGRTTR